MTTAHTPAAAAAAASGAGPMGVLAPTALRTPGGTLLPLPLPAPAQQQDPVAAGQGTGGGMPASPTSTAGTAAAADAAAAAGCACRGAGAKPAALRQRLEEAVRRQLDLQRQLSASLAAHQALHHQLELHGHYVEQLLKEEQAALEAASAGSQGHPARAASLAAAAGTGAGLASEAAPLLLPQQQPQQQPPPQPQASAQQQQHQQQQLMHSWQPCGDAGGCWCWALVQPPSLCPLLPQLPGCWLRRPAWQTCGTNPAPRFSLPCPLLLCPLHPRQLSPQVSTFWMTPAWCMMTSCMPTWSDRGLCRWLWAWCMVTWCMMTSRMVTSTCSWLGLTLAEVQRLQPGVHSAWAHGLGPRPVTAPCCGVS